MRILYSFPHALGATGISSTAYHQVSGLVEQGVVVDLVCTSLARDIPGVRSVRQTLHIGRRIPHRALGVYRAYAFHDWRVARELHGRPAYDVVHTWPAACLRTLRQARSSSIAAFREVPSAHTQTAFEDAAAAAAATGVELPYGHHHRYDTRHLERELLEFDAAEFLLVPSSYVEGTFVHRGVPTSRLIRHSYGFDPASFSASHDLEHNRDVGLRAVFVGRGEPNKGLHIALRAWLDSGAGDRGHFQICGEILPEFRSGLSDLLAHPSVQELGFRSDVAEVMRSAEILVLPSLTEGSALVTYEAQAVGCALLVSDASGAPCTHLVHGLVHSAGDTAALTDHLRQVDSDRSLLDSLRRGALQHAPALTWSAAGARLVEAYQEGIERKSRERTSTKA